VDGDGVEVACDDDAAVAAEVGAGDDGVGIPHHLEVREGRERRLDGAGDGPLVPRHRLDVDELAGEVGDGCGEIEGHAPEPSQG